MGWKKVEDFKKTPRLDPTRNGEGTQSEVILLSAKQVESKNYPGKMNTVYSVKYVGKDLPELVEEFKTEFPDFATDGLMSMWGSPVLDRKLADVEIGPEGVHTLVEFAGEQPHQKRGFNPIKMFDVYFDDGEGETDTVPTGAKKKAPF